MNGSKLNKSPQGKRRRALGPRSDSGYDSRIHGQSEAAENADDKVGGTKTPKLRLTVGEQKRRLSAAELRGSGGDALLKECRSKGSTIVVRLKNLLSFGDEDRLVVLDFLSALDGCTFEAKGKQHPCLLEAVLALFRRDMPPKTLRKARLAALEAAVFKFADSLDVACDAIKRRMQDVGCTGVKPQGLKQDAQAIQTKMVAAARRAASQAGMLVKAAVADAPVPVDAVVPGGWLMSATGVRRAGDGPTQSLSTAVVVTGVCHDVLHGHELVTVAWKRDGGWGQATVERKVVANKNAVLELASHGLPVHSGNAAVLVQFVHDYLVENQTRLGATKASGQMGWQGKDGGDGFLCGRRLITAAGPTGDAGDAGGRYTFRGADGGDEQLAAGFHAAGTYERWLEVAKLIAPYPRVRLGLDAAFVPVMLPIYGSDNFVLDFAGATSQGKTTTLKVGAGAWGRPRGGSGEGTTLHTWDTTQTWRERAPAVTNNLPLFLDDTKTARHPEEVAQTVYTFTQGRGRGRGTVGGLAEQVGFQSVLVSSGEQPLVSFGEHGGTRARVLTLWGSPFGGTDQKTAAKVAAVNAILAENYGHAGPRFVEYVLTNRRKWPTYRKRHAAWTEEFTERAGKNPVAGRMAAHLAAIVYTSRLVHKALDLPWEWENPIDPLYEELTKEVAEADRAAAALRYVMGWAVANRENFFHANGSESEQPHTGWAGRWDRDGEVKQPESSSKWEYIGFIPKTLDKILGEGGFEVDPTVRTWKDRGWLKRTEGRNQFRVKIGRESAWVVAVKRTAVKEVGAA